MSALSDLLATQPLSARQAASKAQQIGVSLPYGTIAAYWAGKHGKPSADTLKLLAQVIDIPEGQLQEAAWGRRAPLGPYVPPSEAVHLSDRQRRAVDELIRSIVADGLDGVAVANERQQLPPGRTRIIGKSAAGKNAPARGDQDRGKRHELGGR